MNDQQKAIVSRPMSEQSREAIREINREIERLDKLGGGKHTITLRTGERIIVEVDNSGRFRIAEDSGFDGKVMCDRKGTQTMTEFDWIASTDPEAMLAGLQDTVRIGPRGSDGIAPILGTLRPSDRKLRLFAVACCRQVYHLLTDERSRKAVEVAERYADGLATPAEIYQARGRSRGVACTEPPCPACMAIECLNALPWDTFAHNVWATNHVPPAAQAATLRDIVGNPWRTVVLPWRGCRCGESPEAARSMSGEPEAWCRKCGLRCACPWLTDTVVALAQASYDERPGRKCDGRCAEWNRPGFYIADPRSNGRNPRWNQCPTCHGTGTIADGRLDPERLLVLADALEEAGATGDLMVHLRSKGPHWRGMWSLDLVLGKE